VKLCASFQKAMFCVTNGAIAGTFPASLSSGDPAALAANRAHATGWAQRLAASRTDCLGWDRRADQGLP
jgi:hypothetical protein